MSVGMHCGVDGLFVADPFLTNSFFDHRDTPPCFLVRERLLSVLCVCQGRR
jgi:hypothetical protein